MSRKVNYSNVPELLYPMNIAYDFSKEDVVNHPGSEEQIVQFEHTNKVIRPLKSQITTGSYISPKTLQEIIKRDSNDQGFYRTLECMQKFDSFKKTLFADFDILRDFFPIELTAEIENYCKRIINKIVERKEKTFTPRIRRTYILSIYRNFCRRNGRAFTEELLHEINLRFNYSRKIKITDIYRAESELVQWKLIEKRKTKTDFQIFYLYMIKHCKSLKETLKDEKDLSILAAAQKFILTILQDKKNKTAFIDLIKHQDKDFAARQMLFSIAKFYAKDLSEKDFTRVENLDGWKSLFMKQTIPLINENEIPIRSFNYIFWNDFNFRNRLRELGLYPGGC